MANISIKVIPKSSRQQVKMVSGVIKVWLKSAPVDGKANAELIEVLADKFDVKKSSVEISSGFTGKTKLVDIMGRTPEEIKKLLT